MTSEAPTAVLGTDGIVRPTNGGLKAGETLLAFCGGPAGQLTRLLYQARLNTQIGGTSATIILSDGYKPNPEEGLEIAALNIGYDEAARERPSIVLLRLTTSGPDSVAAFRAYANPRQRVAGFFCPASPTISA